MLCKMEVEPFGVPLQNAEESITPQQAKLYSELTPSNSPRLPPQPEELGLLRRSQSTPDMNVLAFESRTERLLNQHRRLEVGQANDTLHWPFAGSFALAS